MGNGCFTTKPNKWVIFIALAIPFAAVVLLMLTAGSGQVTPPPTHAKIHSVQVQPVLIQANHKQQRVAYGRVEASTQSHLGFELSGKVIEVLVDEGDVLTKGTLLAKLDTSRLMSSMQELNASLARTEADLRLAELSLKRVQELVAKKLESKQRLDEITESTASAAALVSEIQAKKASLQIELDKSFLYANADSTVLSQPVDQGTVVTTGQTVFVVQQPSVLEVRVGLPQAQAFDLQVGDKHTLFDAENKVPAQVKSIAKQRKLNTRTIDVIFTLDKEHVPDIIPGDLLGFAFQQQIEEAGTWVPKQSLTSGIRGLWTLFVVLDTGQQTISSKSVQILYSERDRIFIRGALRQGDWFVANGGQRLVPGQQVMAKEAKLGIGQ